MIATPTALDIRINLQKRVTPWIQRSPSDHVIPDLTGDGGELVRFHRFYRSGEGGWAFEPGHRNP